MKPVAAQIAEDMRVAAALKIEPAESFAIRRARARRTTWRAIGQALGISRWRAWWRSWQS